MSKQDDGIHLSIIIPAYLEENNIKTTLESLGKYFSTQPYNTEIIVVDDGSTDATSELAQKAGAKVIKFEGNQGKGSAVRAGMLTGSGKYVLFTDADYPYEIDQVVDCLSELRKGADVVIGSRNLPESNRGNEPLKRRIISMIGNIITRMLILPGITDTQAGFKCFTREAAKKIFSLVLIDDWGFDIEVLYIARSNGLIIKEIPVRLCERSVASSRIKSPIRTAIGVFGSIFRVHWNRLTGKYRFREKIET